MNHRNPCRNCGVSFLPHRIKFLVTHLPRFKFRTILFHELFAHLSKLTLECKEIEDVGNQDTKSSFPAIIGCHKTHSPFPGGCNHQYRRSGKMSDGSSDRNVDEKQADGGVGKTAGGLMFIKLVGQ